MIESLERAVRILDLFSPDVPEWTSSAIARELGVSKTTAWEYAQSMVGLGLLRRSGRGKYRLGWRAFQLGLRARITSEIARPARAEMGELVARHREIVQLSSRHDRNVVYLEQVAPRSDKVINDIRVGERVPAHCTAAGKVLLAQLQPEELQDLLCTQEMPRRTARSVGTLAGLAQELVLTRERGYALDREEAIEGMCCVAAPVTNERGNVAWALSMSFSVDRLVTHAERYAEAIVASAQRLSFQGTITVTRNTYPALPSGRQVQRHQASTARASSPPPGT